MVLTQSRNSWNDYFQVVLVQGVSYGLEGNSFICGVMQDIPHWNEICPSKVPENLNSILQGGTGNFYDQHDPDTSTVQRHYSIHSTCKPVTGTTRVRTR